jgi:hypothetical protein
MRKTLRISPKGEDIFQGPWMCVYVFPDPDDDDDDPEEQEENSQEEFPNS